MYETTLAGMARYITFDRLVTFILADHHYSYTT